MEQKELEKASKAVSELSKQLVTAATDAAELLRKGMDGTVHSLYIEKAVVVHLLFSISYVPYIEVP